MNCFESILRSGPFWWLMLAINIAASFGATSVGGGWVSGFACAICLTSAIYAPALKQSQDQTSEALELAEDAIAKLEAK